MLDNTRGLRRVVRRVQAQLRPAVPFSPGSEAKGIWEKTTRAPAHVWRQYTLEARTVAPIRCIVLSDLHVGSQSRDVERFEGIMSEVAGKEPDLVLLPGDFVNMQVFGGGRVPPEMVAALLAPLVSSCPCLAVLGNHDAEYGLDAVAAALGDVGIRVLSNDVRAVQVGATTVHVAGLEDQSTGKPDTAEALRTVPRDALCIVMAHDPASFAAVPDGPVVTVCGHTHGGQVRLPFVGPIVNASEAPMRWTHGHIVERGRHLIVSAGLGTSGLPWRWNCPPEIVEVALVPKT